MQINRENDIYEVAEGHDWFWPGFANGTWEPSTFRIFDAFLKKEGRMLDIGAWIGPTALYAASRCKEIFAFEPDPVAFASLVKNIELNRRENIIPYQIAVANDWKGIPFGPRTGYGDSMSSSLWGRPGDRKIAAAAFQAVVMDIQPSFIKIDIEGGEKDIFKGSALTLETFQPTIHLSLHTPWHLGDLEGFKRSIMEGLAMYPYFYDEGLKRIDLERAFDPNAFNAVVATFNPL